MKLKQRFFFILLLLLFLADLFLMHHHQDFRFISKALLIPVIALYFWASKTKRIHHSTIIFTGLFFSWLGDMFLLFEQYFIPGLICFLITHICYIIYFSKLKGSKQSYLQQRPVMLLVIIAYLFELLYMLWPGLGGLKIPVIIYGTVISSMFAMAAWQYEKIDQRAALFFIFGSFLFVLSDSILAIGKFLQPLPLSGFMVMSTYVFAQLLIVQGAIEYSKHRDLLLSLDDQ